MVTARMPLIGGTRDGEWATLPTVGMHEAKLGTDRYTVHWAELQSVRGWFAIVEEMFDTISPRTIERALNKPRR